MIKKSYVGIGVMTMVLLVSTSIIAYGDVNASLGSWYQFQLKGVIEEINLVAEELKIHDGYDFQKQKLIEHLESMSIVEGTNDEINKHKASYLDQLNDLTEDLVGSNDRKGKIEKDLDAFVLEKNKEVSEYLDYQLSQSLDKLISETY